MRKIADSYGIAAIKINADFLQGLAHRGDLVIIVFGVPLAAWQSNMAIPLVAYPGRTLDEEQLCVSMADPILCEEGV